ncbi:MAG: mucoidy inhibitor MuiA family protein, partial [Bacteroidota bacterium]
MKRTKSLMLVMAFSTSILFANKNDYPKQLSEGLLTASISNEKSIKTSPEKVTIYLQGAQVFRNTTVSLVKGDNYIVFEGLENSIDPASIQAGGSGNCVVTEVQHVVKYPEAEKLKASGDIKFQKAIKNLNDSIKLLDYILEDLQNKKLVLETEKTVLLNYGLYKGTSKKDSILFLKDGLLFLREKLNNIYAELMKLKKDQNKSEEIKTALAQRLQSLQNDLTSNSVNTDDKNKPDYRIALTINTDNPGQVQIKLNYYVVNACWTPFYDLRTNGSDKDVTLTYKGNIKQYTGVDWNNIKITLSTGDPKQNFIIPELNQWIIGEYNVQNNRKTKNLILSNSNTTMFAMPTTKDAGTYAWSEDDYDKKEGINFTYDYTTTDQNMIQAEFEISLAYNIPSDNKNHMVSVNQKELATNYVYKTVPKIDATAFLTARISGWEDMNLLPGNATVYF